MEALDKHDNPHDFERMAIDLLNEEGSRVGTPIAPRGGGDKGRELFIQSMMEAKV